MCSEEVEDGRRKGVRWATYLPLSCFAGDHGFFPFHRKGWGGERGEGEGVVECQFTVLFELLHKIFLVVI